MKFRLSLSEVSGALADLGVLLPLTLALIALNGVDATAAFVGLGLAYALTALAYRLPLPVQPLKSLAATALALGLSASVVAAGAWWMALLFGLLALVPAAARLDHFFPPPVVRGIQLGLSWLLLRSAWGLITQATGEPTFLTLPLSALVSGLVLIVALWRWPAAAGLSVIVAGIALALVQHGFPAAALQPALPVLALRPSLPNGGDFAAALWLLALPQLPLSLANSVYATADAARQYFRGQAARVTPRRLLATMSVNNAVAALLGGVPVCHGSGGLTAHYRLGARTGAAPLLLAVLFLALGVLGGSSLLPLVGLVPGPVLGVLLVLVSLQHARLARDLRGWAAWVPALAVVLTTALTRNLAVGYALGVGVYFGWRGLLVWRRRAAATGAEL